MEWFAADLTSQLLRHERLLIAGAVVLLTAFSWAYVLRGIPMGIMQPPLAALIIMWWVMMLAMMLPSATPAILLYARVRRNRPGNAAIAQPWVFLVGYLVAWLLFSIVAAFAQSLLAPPLMNVASRGAQGAVLIGAGLYQLSPLKSACVSQCRSPAEFISRHWRPRWEGAVRLGLLHGAYCVGCCWLLMALLFVGGVMNLLWVVALAVLVAIEKLTPRGLLLGRAAGVAMVLWGVFKAVA